MSIIPADSTEVFEPLRQCFGRDAELASVDALFGASVTTAGGGVVWVSGPSGIGKAALLDEIGRRLVARGAIVVATRCRAGDEPYRAAIDLLDGARPFFTARGAALGEAARRALTGDRDLLVDGRDAPMLAPERRRASLRERVCAALAAIGDGRPVALLVHDVSLADAASRELLEQLAVTRCSSPPLRAGRAGLAGLLVMSSSDEPGPFIAESAALHLALGALDDEAVRGFLAQPEVVAHLMRASGGRPRALAELLDGRSAIGLAASTNRSIAADRLLDALALAARPMTVGALLRVCGIAPAPVERAVDELLRSRTVVWLAGDGDPRLGLAWPGEAAARAARVTDDHRQELDERLGRELLTDESSVVAAAEHLLRACAGETAVDTAIAAGRRLEAGCGYERAIDLYRRAHALTTLQSSRSHLEERLVELHRLLGSYSEALSYAERIVERAPEAASSHRRVGQLHLLCDDHGRARAALERALALAVDTVEKSRCHALLSELEYLHGHHAAARAEAAAGLAGVSLDGRSGEALGDDERRLQLELRNTLGKVHIAEARYLDAAALFTLNLDAARALGSPFEETRALINQGITHLRAAEPARAAQCYQAALQIADSTDDHRHRAFCLQNLGVLAHWRCEYHTALRYFQGAIAAFQSLGNRSRMAWLALDLASLFLDVGALDRAVAMMRLCERLDEGGRESAVNAVNRTILLGRIALLRGDRDEARAHLEDARRRATTARHLDRHAEATLVLAQGELDAGDLDAASLLVAGLPVAGIAPTLRARALLVSGEVEARRGDAERARRTLLAAVDSFHLLEDLDGELRVQRALAQLASRRGDRREAERRDRLASSLAAALQERIPEELSGDSSRLAESSGVLPSSVVRPSRGRLVGQHARLDAIYDLIDKVAPHDSLVLIRGESGTGKELVAEAIVARSRRADRPFVKVNCGALVESLLLSELFGHERGAFTGAIRRTRGHFETAHGGTLFLDEIGDISPRTQAALLRVLQERQFERVGSCVPIRVDVRIVCATNRDLEAMVRSGQFREDLYYRLQGIQIELPSLRERAEDVPLLAAHFLARVAEERSAPQKSLSVEAARELMRYRWPGNVRELENVIRSVSLFTDGSVICVRDLHAYSEDLRASGKAAPPPPSSTSEPLTSASGAARSPGARASMSGATLGAWERLASDGIGLRELQERIEIECITRALEEARGNITKAAALLKMKRPRLSQLIKEYRIAHGAGES